MTETGSQDRARTRMIQEFISEAIELVESLGNHLLTLDDQAASGLPADQNALNALYRSAHTLKGLSATFGLDSVARLSHAIETILNALRLERLPLSRSITSLLLSSVDVFHRMIEAVQRGGEIVSGEVEGLLEVLEQASLAPQGGAKEDLGLEPALLAPLTEHEEHRLREGVRRGAGIFKLLFHLELDRMEEGMGEVRAQVEPGGQVVAFIPEGMDISTGRMAMVALLTSRLSPDQLARRLSPEHQLVPVARVGAEAVSVPLSSLRSPAQTVRVDINKLDRLMQTVGDLSICRLGISRVAMRLRPLLETRDLALDLLGEVRDLERKINEIQTAVLDIRMIPLAQLFDKLSRVVRRISREAGKEIDFRVQGGDVELDKLIVEELSDPLMHMISNAIDHGIEADRERAGKAREGLVRLGAVQRGNQVVIEVEDDGAGLDVERISRRGRERGLMGEALTSKELMNLIFLPGLTTRESATQISGRGVGLDVVKTNLTRLGGMIDVATWPGRGTRFTITLPITLAIIQALIVQSGQQSFAIPLNSVVEIVDLPPENLIALGGREVARLRGESLAVVRLAQRMGAPIKDMEGSDDPLPVVVVGLAQHRLAMVVDKLVGQQDIVVKPLGFGLDRAGYFAGATSLGDRRTVLVLDMGALIEGLDGPERALTLS